MIRCGLAIVKAKLRRCDADAESCLPNADGVTKRGRGGGRGLPGAAAAACEGVPPQIVLGKASPRDQAFTGSATRCGELLLLDECSVFDDESFSLLVDEDESFQSPRRLARSSHA
jgi:hypothetical protein